MMDAEHAYMAAFLITGDHLEAERARAKVRRSQLVACRCCGCGTTAYFTQDELDNAEGFIECDCGGEYWPHIEDLY